MAGDGHPLPRRRGTAAPLLRSRRHLRRRRHALRLLRHPRRPRKHPQRRLAGDLEGRRPEPGRSLPDRTARPARVPDPPDRRPRDRGTAVPVLGAGGGGGAPAVPDRRQPDPVQPVPGRRPNLDAAGAGEPAGAQAGRRPFRSSRSGGAPLPALPRSGQRPPRLPRCPRGAGRRPLPRTVEPRAGPLFRRRPELGEQRDRRRARSHRATPRLPPSGPVPGRRPKRRAGVCHLPRRPPGGCRRLALGLRRRRPHLLTSPPGQRHQGARWDVAVPAPRQRRARRAARHRVLRPASRRPGELPQRRLAAVLPRRRQDLLAAHPAERQGLRLPDRLRERAGPRRSRQPAGALVDREPGHGGVDRHPGRNRSLQQAGSRQSRGRLLPRVAASPAASTGRLRPPGPWRPRPPLRADPAAAGPGRALRTCSSGRAVGASGGRPRRWAG